MDLPLALLLLATLAVIAARSALRDRVVDVTALAYLRAPVDTVAFALRRALRWRRGVAPLPSESKLDLFGWLPRGRREAAQRREAELRARYDLGALHARSSRAVYRANLYVLDLLDRYADGALGDVSTLRALDIGSQDFRYAFALERWLRHAGAEDPRAVALDGVEVDGYRVYDTLYSRADVAEAHCRATGNPEVRYVVGDVLEHADVDLDVVFCWYPFVLRYALVRWGLPLSHFAPERIFEHAARMLRPGGMLVVVNHTREEQARQVEILRATEGVEVLWSGAVASDLCDDLDAQAERTMTIARRVDTEAPRKVRRTRSGARRARGAAAIERRGARP